MNQKKNKKLVYFTPESFIDVDMPLLPVLKPEFDLQWMLTFGKQKDELRKFKPDDVIAFAEAEKIDLLVHKFQHRVRDPRRFFDALKLLSMVLKQKPDLVYFETFSDPFLPLLVRLRLGRKKVIVGIHDAENHSGVGSRFHDLRDRFVNRLFRHYLLFSLSQEKIFLRDQPGKITHTIPLPVKDFGPVSNPKGQSEKKERFRFLFFGTVLPYKGLEVLLEAAKLLAQRRQDFEVQVSGRWSDYQEQANEEAYAGTLKVDNRLIANEEIPALFTDSDCLVLPYRDVTQSGPLLIGMKYNLPALTSELDGFKEFVRPGKTGWMFESENPSALADTMSAILDLQMEDISRIRKTLKQEVDQEFEVAVVGKKLARIFNSIINKD